MTVKEFLAVTHVTQETTPTVRWLCEPILLSIGHFEDSNVVQLNSWWKFDRL